MKPRLIDEDRIQRRIAELAQIGRNDEGGIDRLAFSPADAAARRLVIRWMENLGLAVRVDAAGNILGRREGLDKEAPPLMLGSHVDSVPNGGRFDGCLGVIAALEVVEILNERGIVTPRPVEIVSFQMEESSRFALAMFGSRVMAGNFDRRLFERRDKDGIRLYDCLREAGLDPEQLHLAQRQPGDIDGFLELHIDQGKILQQYGKPVGLVTAIAGPSRWQCRLVGEACHSGGTLPEHRRDALTAAAEVILAVERLSRAYRDRELVATIGTLQLKPGAINVIPGEVVLGLDIRGVQLETIRRFVQELQEITSELTEARSIDCAWSLIAEDEPVPIDDDWLSILEEQCRLNLIPYEKMVSLPAHDAMQIARLAPIGMILVRNASGTSHSPNEFIDPADIAVAVELYCRTALERLHVGDRALPARDEQRSTGM